MKIDPDKLFEKLAVGLKESSDSLRNIPIDLTGRIKKDWAIVKMLEDPAGRCQYPRLLDCTYENEDIYDHVFRQNVANEGLVAISATTDAYDQSSFNAKITRLKDLRLLVEITEKFSVSNSRGLGKLYDNGERVDFTTMQPDQILDWICRIVQCSVEELFDRLDKKDLKTLFSSDYKKYFDKDGLLRSEFSELSTHEILESSLDFDAVVKEFMPYVITKHWQLETVKRGWTKNYEYEIDYSDAIIQLDEKQLDLKEKVRDRIYSRLAEEYPFKFNFNAVETQLVDSAFEMIALRMKDASTYGRLELKQIEFDEESLFSIFERYQMDNLISCVERCEISTTASIVSLGKDTDRYEIYYHPLIYISYFKDSVVYISEYERFISTEDCMRMLAEDRNLDFEENYESLKNEVLENYYVNDFSRDSFPVKVEIDFEDLY